MDEKDLKKLTDGINEKFAELQKAVDKGDEGVTALKSELTEMVEKATKVDEKSVADYAKEIQDHANTLEARIKAIEAEAGVKVPSFEKQMLAKLKSDEYKAVCQKQSRRTFDFNVKAANIDTDDINSGTIEAQVETGVAKAPWRPTPIWDAVNKGVIGEGRDQIAWWEETTRTDSAQMVTEQAAPAAGSAKTFTKQSMDIKMIKDFTKVSRSALEDFEYIMSEINDLMANGIPREREAQLLSGSGSGTNLKGIDEYYKTFAKPANFDAVADPNDGDVLAAAILQVMNGNTSDAEKKGFLPSLVLVNPGTAVNMRLLKSSIDTYILHPMASADGNWFNGIKVATSLDLAAGQFIVGDFARAKIYVKRNMNISFHYENEDDVLNDLVLVLASMRLAGLKVAASDAYAFVGGTFTAGKSLITLTA